MKQVNARLGKNLSEFMLNRIVRCQHDQPYSGLGTNNLFRRKWQVLDQIELSHSGSARRYEANFNREVG